MMSAAFRDRYRSEALWQARAGGVDVLALQQLVRMRESEDWRKWEIELTTGDHL